MTHEDYMGEALALAQEALEAGEVPVGCVVVWEGRIVGRGRNRREGARTALGHAEIEAIHQACRTLGGLAAAPGGALRDAGALPHVRRGHTQRPDRPGALWRQGPGGGVLRLGAQSL